MSPAPPHPPAARRHRAAHPGLSRYQLIASNRARAAGLEDALGRGLVHLAPGWTARTRQPVTGVYPGPPPRAAAPTVSIGELRAARRAACWSQQRLADRLGVARTTIERWERDYQQVPGWAVPPARQALAEARAQARDLPAERRAAVLRELEHHPHGLTRKQLRDRCGWSQQILTAIDELIADGKAHQRHVGRRGQRHAVFAGPAPAAELTAEQLRALRHRAGLRQAELAAAADTQVQAIRDWEGARRPISIDWQRRLRDDLEARPDAAEPRRLALLAAMPATRHQLDLAGLGSRGQLDQALAELLATGRAHHGRVDTVTATGVHQRRRGYRPGPPPTAQ